MRRLGARPGRVLAWVAAVVVFAAVLSLAGMAYAATGISVPVLPASPQLAPGVMQLFDQLSNSPVYEQECYFCHGQIATSPSFASEIKFSHAEHIKIECMSCHPRFPHSANGTVKPTMQMCFNCHGVRHGNMGLLANDACTACHRTPRTLMPTFHNNVADWKGTGHDAPAKAPAPGINLTATNTRCMMCHTQAECVACHQKSNVSWEPPNGSWDYNSQQGCQACHGQSTLLKAGPNGSADSFFVNGLDTSAHDTVTCQQCHIDFTYRDTKSPSKLWQINAGIGCQECHAITKPKVSYKDSIHYVKLQQFLAGDQSISTQSTDTPTVPATCASCHGGHFIMKTDTDFAKQMMHSSAQLTCARTGCHTGRYASYNDYYHGAAYKDGAPDAPACWQCHGSHDVWPAQNKQSFVNVDNLPSTCGGAHAKGYACHKNATEQFTANAGQLIHQKVAVAQTNILRTFFENLATSVRSRFSR